MPLIHKKTPSAFKENIRREMHAGKPQKQAVAIAYSEQRKASHKAHGGPIEGCPNCMADGGEIEIDEHEEEDDKPKATGTLENYHETGKNTPVGKMQREADLKEFRHMPAPKIKGLYEGGKVLSSLQSVFGGGNEAGASELDTSTANKNKKPDPHVENEQGPQPAPGSTSTKDLDEEKSDNWANEAHGGLLTSASTKIGMSGHHSYDEDEHEEEEHSEAEPREPATGTLENYHPVGKNKAAGKMDRKQDLKEYKSSAGPKIRGLADGGEVGDDDGGDSEIHEMLGQDIMDAIHKKDHKRIMDGIEACVLQCMNKRGN